MKERIKDSEDWLDRCQGEGVLRDRDVMMDDIQF